MRFRTSLQTLALAAVCATDLASQRPGATPTPPSPAVATSSRFKALKWRLVGPFRGGRADAVAGDPTKPLVFYFGAVNGGVWKTTNGGQTWRNITDGKSDISSVGAIAVAPSDPNVIYVGSGEAAAARRSDVRRRRLPLDRRRPDLDAPRSRRHAADRRRRRRPARRRSRLRRRDRPRLRTERRARRVSHDATAARRGRRCSSSTTPPARCDVAHGSDATRASCSRRCGRSSARRGA